jgi:hypothetical protein
MPLLSVALKKSQQSSNLFIWFEGHFLKFVSLSGCVCVYNDPEEGFFAEKEM